MNKSATGLNFALLGASLLIASAGLTMAQSTLVGNPTEITGKVEQYSLTPRGNVEGLILTDGTELRLPPHVSTRLVFAVRPGDAVTIRGVIAATSLPMIVSSVTNNATGVVVDAGPPAPPQRLDDESRVKLQLHDPDGRLNGVLLEDGAVVRMPSPDAEQHATDLAIGEPFYASGYGISGSLGKIIAAREIGPTKTELTEIDEPRFERWMHDFFGGDDAPPHVIAPLPPIRPKA
jgi:hypothetical protein